MLCSHLFHNRGQTAKGQSMIIFPGDDGTAQLDHQPAGILELAALREGGMRLLQTPLRGHQLK